MLLHHKRNGSVHFFLCVFWIVSYFLDGKKVINGVTFLVLNFATQVLFFTNISRVTLHEGHKSICRFFLTKNAYKSESSESLPKMSSDDDEELPPRRRDVLCFCFFLEDDGFPDLVPGGGAGGFFAPTAVFDAFDTSDSS